MHHWRYQRPNILSAARRRLRQLVLKVYRWSFPHFERLGFHVIPNHYTQPIPDTRRLSARLWERPSQVQGVDLRESEQIALLETFRKRYAAEYAALGRGGAARAYDYVQPNGLFDAVDAEILYCMVRHFKPKLILEVGSGFSTFAAAVAVRKRSEEGAQTRLVCLEPAPHPTLATGFPGLSTLIPKRVQDVDLSAFAELSEGDILFIDSSHIVQIGSDVEYLFLEVIPRLKPGVVIHVHDIFIPAEYPKIWVLRDYYFWNEQYILQAFLAFNERFRVLWGASFMHLNHPDLLAAAFPTYRRDVDWPGSFWFQRVG